MNPTTHVLRPLIGCTLVGLLAGLCSLLPPGRALEEQAIDFRLAHQARDGASDEVVLVGIGDDDLRTLGSWPFPRGVHADVLRILQTLEPAHITFDILLTEASAAPDQDARLRDVINETSGFTLAYFFERIGDTPALTASARTHFFKGKHYGYNPERGPLPLGQAPVPPFTPLTCGFGAANAAATTDGGRIREVPLFIRHAERLYPSLAMQTVISALQVEADQISVLPGDQVTLAHTPRGTLHAPLSRDGLYRINYGAALTDFKGLDYSSLYRAVQDADYADSLRKLVNGHIVLIGYVATGSYDVLPTPIGSMPGLAVHANIISNLLRNDHLWIAPRWLHLILPVLFGGLLGALMRHRRRINSGLIFITGLVVLGILFYAGTRDLMLPVIPILGTWIVVLFAGGLVRTVPSRSAAAEASAFPPGQPMTATLAAATGTTAPGGDVAAETAEWDSNTVASDSETLPPTEPDHHA